MKHIQNNSRDKHQKPTSSDARKASEGPGPNPTPLTESEYNQHMARIEALMNKGSDRLSEKELTELRTLSLLAPSYEQQHYVLEPPTSFGGLLERKMYELKMKQVELARRLQVSPAKLSLIISGKQKPDVAVIKAAYYELQVDADLLLRVL